jgi:hypothetical protein
LLTYAIHSSLLLGLAWVAGRRLTNPTIREALWKTALVGSLVTATLHSAGMGAGGTTLSVAAPPRALVPADLPPTSPLAVEKPNEDRVGERADAGAPGPSGKAEASWSLAAVMVLAWSLVAGLLVLGFGFRRWQLARRLGGRVLVRGHAAVEELAQLRRDSGLRRPVVLTVCDRLPSDRRQASEGSVPGLR